MRWPIRRYAKRVALAGGLFAVGVLLLFVPIPYGVGSLAEILSGHPGYISFLFAWYFVRPSFAAVTHLTHRRRSNDRRKTESDEDLPALSVIIPAYNEEDIIEQSIESVLMQRYPAPIEVLVVNDGSTDATWEILQRCAAEYDAVRVFTQRNQGAGTAQNLALEKAQHEIVVKLDADTKLEPNALLEIARPFVDEDVVGVGGNVQVLNDRNSVVACIQSIEYALSMELGRMFQSRLRHLLCISGAFGAYRREELRAAGGWVANPRYGEDFDITIRMHEFGKIWFTPDAIALTDVPPTVRSWWRQRFRWTVNGVLTIALHWRAILNPGYGLAGLVGLPLKLVLLVLLATQRGGLVLLLIAGTVSSALTHLSYILVVLSLATGAFALMVLTVATLFLVYRRPLRNLPVLPVYLFVYRPLHGAVRIVGIGRAITKLLVGAVGGVLRRMADRGYTRRLGLPVLFALTLTASTCFAMVLGVDFRTHLVLTAAVPTAQLPTQTARIDRVVEFAKYQGTVVASAAVLIALFVATANYEP